MTTPRLLARLQVTNGLGTFDSQNPAKRRGDTLDSVRISATVTKTIDPTPNTAEIELFNLADETVDSITGTVRVRQEWTPEEKAELLAKGASADPIELTYDNFGMGSIVLSWGYEGASPTTPFPPLSIGFIGGSTNMTIRSDGLDSILTIKAEDGGQLLGAGRLQRSYSQGANYINILADLLEACGVSVDKERLTNAIQAVLLARGISVSSLQTLRGYNAGTAPAATQIKTVMDSLQLRWSIQDGEFLVLDSNTVLAGYEPILLSSDANTLWGNPERLEAQQMRAQTWANAELRPGRQALLEAVALGTQYRVDKAVHALDTIEGGDTTVTLSALQTIEGLF